MRAVVQRVSRASVSVNGMVCGSIKSGLLVYLANTESDSETDIEYIVNKIIHLRIFSDKEGVMNRSVIDCNGSLLLVSQFTLYGDARRGRRPGYSAAAPAKIAKPLFDSAVEKFRNTGLMVSTGIFQADMLVNSENDGPVTILIDSKKQF